MIIYYYLLNKGLLIYMMLSKKVRKHFNQARELSFMVDSCKFHLGAVLVKAGKVIAVGINRNVNEPENCQDNVAMISVHAEESALKSYGTHAQGTSLFVVRTLASTGALACSKPCERCMAQLIEAGVKKVYFIDSQGLPDMIRLYHE